MLLPLHRASSIKIFLYLVPEWMKDLPLLLAISGPMMYIPANSNGSFIPFHSLVNSDMIPGKTVLRTNILVAQIAGAVFPWMKKEEYCLCQPDPHLLIFMEEKEK